MLFRSAKDLQAKAAAKGITTVDKAFKADIKRVMTTATGEAKATITATEVIALASQWKTTVDKVAPMIQWLSADDLLIQAEDGIRDWSVTGVQTCALPIFKRSSAESH